MNQNISNQNDNYSDIWQNNVFQFACTNCQTSFLLLEDTKKDVCPNCLQPSISSAGKLAESSNHLVPEEVIPFEIDQSSISQRLTNFTKGIPYPPEDLTYKNISDRILQVYLPVWYVDTSVAGQWHAEAGFNYDVVSHKDQYNQNTSEWTSVELNETRIRWEPRAGNLDRSFTNIPAPALEHETKIKNQLGEFTRDNAQPYKDSIISETAYLELPNRDTDDAWVDAKVEIMRNAMDQCKLACAADHIRNFKWQVEYGNHNWTLLLRPTLTSYYLDDEAKPHKIFINGVSGQLYGEKIASMRRAQARSLTFVITAAIIFFIGLVLGGIGLLFPPLLFFGGLLLLIGVFVGLAAAIPIIQVWRFNQQRKSSKSS